LAAVGAQLDKETFALLWSEGPRLTTEQVFATGEQAFNDAQALQPLPSQASTPAHSTTPNMLTEREGEILALLAAGLTNKQIAARLVLSPHTVSVHVQAIYRKVGVSSRSQATRYAIKHGLV
jgi:DNA-binding NarL/FixJ family response regulator